jgi:hypothetical protein
MRLWKLKMKGTTREIEGWGIYYSRTNRSPYLLEFSKHHAIGNLGSSYAQMTRDVFLEFIAII